MSNAMMFRDNVKFREILRSLGPQTLLQDAQRDPETAVALLNRLDGDHSEEGVVIPDLSVAGINRDGCVIFVKTRKEATKSKPVWINLNVPPPDRFQIVSYDSTAISKQLAQHIEMPPSQHLN